MHSDGSRSLQFLIIDRDVGEKLKNFQFQRIREYLSKKYQQKIVLVTM